MSKEKKEAAASEAKPETSAILAPANVSKVESVLKSASALMDALIELAPQGKPPMHERIMFARDMTKGVVNSVKIALDAIKKK